MSHQKNDYAYCDILEQTNITIDAYERWQELCIQAVHQLKKHNFTSTDIPDEQGKILDDGSLLIFVELPVGGKIEMKVPPGKWAWRH